MTYGRGTATLSNIATDDDNINALLDYRRWDGKVVTFGFTSDFQNDYENEIGYPDSDRHSTSFQAFNQQQKRATRSWIKNYESVIDFEIIELEGTDARNATIRMAASNLPFTAFAYFPDLYVESGDIWFNASDYNNPDVGDYEYLTIGHELGHAFGLKHAHERGGISNRAIAADLDAMEFTITTYRSYVGQQDIGSYSNDYNSGYAQSLMMYDIGALQSQYGANFKHNAGDTTYRLSPGTGELLVNGKGQGQPGSNGAASSKENRIFRTLWDGNGVDTYDFSNYRSALAVDLRPGKWNDLDVGGKAQRADLGNGNYARAHVYNALQSEGDVRSLIENARGGAGNDSLVGNKADNDLQGGTGNDILSGAGGNDTLSGDAGDDVLKGDAGDDVLKGGSGNDQLFGGGGDDRMLGGAGNDEFWGGLGNHVISGGGGTDSVSYKFWTEGGIYDLSNKTAQLADTYTDTLRGIENITTDAGADTVIGNAKDNRFNTGRGNDNISGGGGDDYLLGGGGNDILRGGAGNDYLSGTKGNSKDRDVLISGTLQDRDTFVLGEEGQVFYANDGNKDYAIIQDFAISGKRKALLDTIQLAGSSADYSLQDVSIDGGAIKALANSLGSTEGTGVYFDSDLIGIVQSVSIGSLDLNNTSQFSYV